MTSNSSNHGVAPRKVIVGSLVSSRYPSNQRPEDWDSRKDGVDVVRTSDGEELRLLSDGQQSPPMPGWSLIITGGDSSTGFRWTLYGLSPAQAKAH